MTRSEGCRQGRGGRTAPAPRRLAEFPIDFLHRLYGRPKRSSRTHTSCSRRSVREFHCISVAGLEGQTTPNSTLESLRDYVQWAKKSHDPCFHVFVIDAGVMTFVTHCTLAMWESSRTQTTVHFRAQVGFEPSFNLT